MKKKQKIYTIGDRPSFYLKKHTPDQIVSLINKQSDLTLLVFHALELYYDKYGNTDCSTILPRNYQFLAKHSPTFDLTPLKVSSEKKAVQPKEQLSQARVTKTDESLFVEQTEQPFNDNEPEKTIVESEPDIEIETTHHEDNPGDLKTDLEVDNKPKSAWNHLDVEEDPYA